MEASIEYRICEKRPNKPRVKVAICATCIENCEFAGARPRWLKDCEICNVGLCSCLDELVEKGMSIREAARRMEKESEGLYSESAIRNRYQYYKDPNRKKAGGISATPKSSPQKSSPSTPKVPAPRIQQKREPQLEPDLTPDPEPMPDSEELFESDELQSLKFFWQKAGDEDRETFLEWIAMTDI